MCPNLKNYSTVIVFLLITIGGLMIVFGLVVVMRTVMNALGGDADIWAMIESVATAIAAASVFGAAFVANRELSEISDSRHLEVANQLFGELNSAENIAARRWIFQNLPDDPATALPLLTTEGRDAIKQVLNSLDHVAFLTQAKWIPEDIIMPWMHPMIAKSWKKLEPYVLYERQRRKEPEYYLFASRLAERTQAWRKNNLQRDEEFVWFEDAL